MKTKNSWRVIYQNESGQGLTEYVTLILLIAIVSIGVTKTLGGRVKAKIEEASNHINSELTLSTGK